MTKCILLISLLLSWGSLFAKINHGANEDPAKVTKALLQVQDQIKKTEKTIYQSHRQERDLIQQLSQYDKEIGEKSELLRQLLYKIGNHTLTFTNLHSQSQHLKQTSQAQQKALTQLIQATFVHYQKDKLRLLFSQHEWSTLARLNQYYHIFYNERAKQITILQEHLKQIELLQQKITEEQLMMQSLSEKLQLEQNLLQEKKTKRKALIIQLAKERLNSQEQLSELQKQEHHLEALLLSLQKKLATTPTYIEPAQDFAKMKKKLTFPIQGQGIKLSVLPHLKKSNDKKTYIAASTGTPVNAIFPGKVVFAEWLRGVGLLMIIDHGNGYMSLYGNNQKLYKGLGEWVNQGEMIARVGQSGGHAEPGLYFEIRKGTEALDPTPWFNQG